MKSTHPMVIALRARIRYLLALWAKVLGEAIVAEAPEVDRKRLNPVI